jgi:two-component system, NtrC family, sensor kinase
MIRRENAGPDRVGIEEDELPGSSGATAVAEPFSNSEYSLGLALLRHELAQPLTHLATLLDVTTARLTRALDEGEGELLALEQPLAAAREATAHLSALVRGIGRGASGRTEQRIDVQSIVESALAICGVALSRRATVACQFLVRATVQGVPDELRQLLLNVLTNAALAIEHGPAEVNRIAIRVLAVDPARVAIEVSDTGVGVPAALRGSISDPWVTTRGGHGSGLGLVVCAQVVESFNGELAFSDGTGGGTTVRIVLPASGIEPAKEEPESQRTGRVPTSRHPPRQ